MSRSVDSVGLLMESLLSSGSSILFLTLSKLHLLFRCVFTLAIWWSPSEDSYAKLMSVSIMKCHLII